MLIAAPPCMQVPAEKRVYVHDEGKNDLGLARSWYRVAPVREYTADEWCDTLLRGWYGGATATERQGPMTCLACTCSPRRVRLPGTAA